MNNLLDATARLVAVPSVSTGEAAMADLVAVELSGHPLLDVVRIGDNVVARTMLARKERLVLAGHLDTVPPSGNESPSLHDEVLHGVGSADMKGGLAVMLALARLESFSCDVSFVFYAREEIARSESGLLEIARSHPELLEGDAAILMEPTAALVEAGCQGVVKAEVVVGGARAHVARPWTGVNAVHRLGPVLDAVSRFSERQLVIDGCTYRESLQAVRISGGHAANVVPDEASVVLSYRFAPDKDLDGAMAVLHAHFAPVLDPGAGDEVRLLDGAPAAAPALTHRLLSRLVTATGQPPAAKLGWTDVAFFAERGVPGANYGPGDPLLAHRPDECVTRRDLEACYATLAELLSGS